jgi:phosphoribosylamine-glycine ligase
MKMPDIAIYNLTQHAPTAEQIEAGVVQPKSHAELIPLLTFHHKPDRAEVGRRATAIAYFAQGLMADAVMIGGAPYLMGPLTDALKDLGIEVCFSYSERVSVESSLPDGSVTKTSVFKHVGFVWA